MPADDKPLLLAILVLPIVAGVICWFVVALQTPTQIQNYLPKTSPPRAKASDTLGVLSIADAYDPNRNILWENQVFALQRLGSQVKITELLALWEQYLHTYPELYEKTTFLDWFAFLQKCNLAESDGTVVRLTANGRDFLNLLICNADLLSMKRVAH